MDNEMKVQITSEPGVRGQFGKGHFSYQNTKKIPKNVTAISCVAIVVTVGVVGMQSTPTKNKSDQVSSFLGITVPVAQSTAEIFNNIPKASESPDSKPRANESRDRPHGKGVRFSGPELVTRPRNITIPPGTMVKAALVSGASNGSVKAELKEPLIVNGETLIDQGTMLYGSGQSGNDRLMIHFKKAVFRDGSVAVISAEAADSDDNIVGIKGNQVGYRALKLAAGIGLNFVGGMSQGLQDTQGSQGAVVAPPTVKNALLNGAAHASIEEGQNVMTEYRNEKPVIEVSAGTLITVIFEDTAQ